MTLFVALTTFGLVLTVTLVFLPVPYASGEAWAGSRFREQIAVSRLSETARVVQAETPILTKGGSTSWT